MTKIWLYTIFAALSMSPLALAKQKNCSVLVDITTKASKTPVHRVYEFHAKDGADCERLGEEHQRVKHPGVIVSKKVKVIYE